MITAKQILSIVAKEYEVSVRDITGSSRKRPLPECRRVVCRLMDDLGFERQDIAYTLRMDRSNLSGQLRILNDELTLYRDTREHFQSLLMVVNNLLNKVNDERETELK